jgi:hypothetical protein
MLIQTYGLRNLNSHSHCVAISVGVFGKAQVIPCQEEILNYLDAWTIQRV